VRSIWAETESRRTWRFSRARGDSDDEFNLENQNHSLSVRHTASIRDHPSETPPSLVVCWLRRARPRHRTARHLDYAVTRALSMTSRRATARVIVASSTTGKGIRGSPDPAPPPSPQSHLHLALSGRRALTWEHLSDRRWRIAGFIEKVSRFGEPLGNRFVEWRPVRGGLS